MKLFWGHVVAQHLIKTLCMGYKKIFLNFINKSYLTYVNSLYMLKLIGCECYP